MLGDNGIAEYRRLICLERICSKRGRQWAATGAVHSLSVDQCPFERRLSRTFGTRR